MNKSDSSQNGKTAIVTGASSGIGLEISRRLGTMGYQVYGFGRDFAGNPLWEQDGYHAIACDLLDTERMCAHVKQIAAAGGVSVLVNNAGAGYYGLHEELNPQKIKEMVRVNLEAPMILAQQLLRGLKKNKGYIINIVSVTAKQSNPHGCAYGAVKAGLAGLSASLFDEVRKYGVKVASIFPDMTKTNLYRNADFCQGDEEESYLMPQETADAVEYILSQREGMVITDITLKPQLHRIKRARCRNGQAADRSTGDRRL